MSIRRVNSTGRVKILREDAKFFIESDPKEGLAFGANLNLQDYDLPANAQVFVEAYRQTTFMRFPFGTVSAPRPSASHRQHLTEFASRDGILFRVKVTAVGNRPGVLLAEADRIPVSDDAEEPDNRVSLLPPLGTDLGQELWRVDVQGDKGPLLLVNEKVGDWKAVAASPEFRALVYPAAMREVLWRIYKIEEMRALDDMTDWRCRWLSFARNIPGAGEPPLDSDEDEQWQDWIDDAVESFCRGHQFLDHYKAKLDEEQK